jgi:LuxR family quorum-sensing system transcriptional regulator CciR
MTGDAGEREAERRYVWYRTDSLCSSVHLHSNQIRDTGVRQLRTIMHCPRFDIGSTAIADILDRLTVRSSGGIREAAQALHEAALSIAQLRTAACSNIASGYPMVDEYGRILSSEIFGWCEPGERWWEQSFLALDSPVTLACRYESQPFWCNSIGIHTQHFNPHLEALDFTDLFERATTEVVIVVPIHLPYGQIGAVSFQPVDSDRDDLTQEFLHYGDLLGLFAHKFVASYVKVTEKQRWIPLQSSLSEREIECLRWAAVGMTDGEIAAILWRSCATVRFHMHNAAVKLNAVNRSQAVFRAGQLGFLGSVSSELRRGGEGPIRVLNHARRSGGAALVGRAIR